jgi:IMP cyclohydrolase
MHGAWRAGGVIVYVGRIVAVGKTGRPCVAYRVSSRSFPNRIARIGDMGVAIEPLDPDDMKKNPYIAYNCIRVSERAVVVSNGAHTDPISDRLQKGAAPELALQQVLSEMGYERDELNTPRIAGVVTDAMGFLGVARKDGVEVAGFELKDNSCRVICTYQKDRLENVEHPFLAASAIEAAKYVVHEGIFREFGEPICSAAWMGELAVYNPHT